MLVTRRKRAMVAMGIFATVGGGIGTNKLRATSVCPSSSSPFEEPWSPLPWRAPIKLCRCAEGTFCRGPYCHASLDHATNTTRWTAALLGCGTRCACVPQCADPLDCWADDCVCTFTLKELYLPHDPTAPHSPRAVADVLADALPPELLEGGALDRRFRNPCWRKTNIGASGGDERVDSATASAQGPLRCLPFAYIPGVLKCATSAMHDTLEKHPQVLVSYPKETHWWTRFRLPYMSPDQQLPESRWLVNHAGRIEHALRRGAPEPVVIEGSASLFWEQPFGTKVLVPELIHAVAPRTRFILMVRDPADRL